MKIGIDVGSTGIKIVITPPGNGTAIAWKKVIPTKPGQSGLVKDLIRQGLEALNAGPADISSTCVTGYGRNLVNASSKVVDEISANAAGMHCLSKGKARTLINIGGQDVKVIKLSEQGQILDFKMNDKCAAGTGRFFEMAATILDIPLEDFNCPADTEAVGINATCAVFAESEIVSLLAKGIDKHRIIKGINNAVAKRIANLAGGSLDTDVYADGGPALNKGLVQSLEDELFCDIKVLPAPQFTVALGAVLAG